MLRGDGLLVFRYVHGERVCFRVILRIGPTSTIWVLNPSTKQEKLVGRARIDRENEAILLFFKDIEIE